MKQLTAFLTAAVILFSLSPTAWAQAEEAEPETEPEAEMMPVAEAEPSGDPAPAAGVESIYLPDNPAGSEIDEIAADAVMSTNRGTVIENNGTVENNVGRIETNAGIVDVNASSGTVCVNGPTGTVTQNLNSIETNDGYVEFNGGTIKSNSGTVDVNIGKVIFNDGFVIDSGKYGKEEVTFNISDVQCARSPDEVKYNAGRVFQYTPDGDDFNEVIYYGVVYSKDCLPQDVTLLFLLNAPDAKEQLYGEVNAGHLVFTTAKSDSGDPAVNGVLHLLTEEEVPFKNAGYSLDGWLDANNDNAEYAPGEDVTVTAPLWLMPRWVLIPVSPDADAPEDGKEAAAPKAGRNGTAYLAVPAAAPQAVSWELFIVTVTSSDPRVTKDSVLPTAALRLSADLAEVLRIWPLQIELDGEFLPSDSYSLTFHQDGTATLLFSRTLLSSLSTGEHEITLYLQNDMIDVTLLLTEPTPEETSSRARKYQASSAFTNQPESSAAGQKGKSG